MSDASQGILCQPVNAAFAAGDQVVVRDQQSQVIGTTTFDAPTYDLNNSPLTCNFTVAFARVPDRPFYSITIGQHPPLTYSRSDLVQAGWNLSLTLRN
jgi:hypothetical protein